MSNLDIIKVESLIYLTVPGHASVRSLSDPTSEPHSLLAVKRSAKSAGDFRDETLPLNNASWPVVSQRRSQAPPA